MNRKRLNTYYSSPRELNILRDGKGRSNSLLHRKEFANKVYNSRISLSPLGELKIDLRNQIPTSHIQDVILKTNYLNELDEIKAFDKANKQADIHANLKKHKYQLLLEKDSSINKRCKTKNNEIRTEFDNRKRSLRDQLTSIIKDSLTFAKKNNPVVSMLPPEVNEFYEKMKAEGDDTSVHFSTSSKTLRSNTESKVVDNKKSKKFKKKHKNEFLSSIGLDVDNLSINNINIDMDKAWKTVLKWAKGRNVDEILRYKMVNSIMSLTEKKASDKATQIYKKFNIYKALKKKEKEKELKKKKEEEAKKMEEFRKNNPRGLMQMKMKESLGEPKKFPSPDARPKKMKKKKKEEPPAKKEIIRLNAYDDIDEIIRFIEDSATNSQSKYYRDHFKNIRRAKTMNENMRRIAYKNSIVERK